MIVGIVKFTISKAVILTTEEGYLTITEVKALKYNGLCTSEYPLRT